MHSAIAPSGMHPPTTYFSKSKSGPGMPYKMRLTVPSLLHSGQALDSRGTIFQPRNQ
jgi:hypothetical protein